MRSQDRDWIEAHFDKLRHEIVKVQLDIAALKVKAGIWGVFGGLIPIVITIGVYFVTRGD